MEEQAVMARLSMESLVFGNKYTALELAAIWNYKSHHALVKGIVTPEKANQLILFVTKIKQSGATQYEDELIGNILYMMGQTAHGTDNRIIQNLEVHKDDIYLFYREIHHTPFTYFGKCTLVGAKVNDDKPSNFCFLIEESIDDEEKTIDLIDQYLKEQGKLVKLNEPIYEGIKRITKHITYERNPVARLEAIKLHGYACAVCGFDFNKFYGEETAKSYIEVHHIQPLAFGPKLTDPSKDLVTICANCHRMLHRSKNTTLTVEDLSAILKRKRN